MSAKLTKTDLNMNPHDVFWVCLDSATNEVPKGNKSPVIAGHRVRGLGLGFVT
jgi:hypothetical protein